jgi:hypothetical protein
MKQQRLTMQHVLGCNGNTRSCTNNSVYETATFNDATCTWDVTGTQILHQQPHVETATFNDATCTGM